MGRCSSVWPTAILAGHRSSEIVVGPSKIVPAAGSRARTWHQRSMKDYMAMHAAAAGQLQGTGDPPAPGGVLQWPTEHMPGCWLSSHSLSVGIQDDTAGRSCLHNGW